jgi:hypothetical protein
MICCPHSGQNRAIVGGFVGPSIALRAMRAQNRSKGSDTSGENRPFGPILWHFHGETAVSLSLLH